MAQTACNTLPAATVTFKGGGWTAAAAAAVQPHCCSPAAATPRAVPAIHTDCRGAEYKGRAYLELAQVLHGGRARLLQMAQLRLGDLAVRHHPVTNLMEGNGSRNGWVRCQPYINSKLASCGGQPETQKALGPHRRVRHRHSAMTAPEAIPSNALQRTASSRLSPTRSSQQRPHLHRRVAVLLRALDLRHNVARLQRNDSGRQRRAVLEELRQMGGGEAARNAWAGRQAGSRELRVQCKALHFRLRWRRQCCQTVPAAEQLITQQTHSTTQCRAKLAAAQPAPKSPGTEAGAGAAAAAPPASCPPWCHRCPHLHAHRAWHRVRGCAQRRGARSPAAWAWATHLPPASGTALAA